MGTISFKAGGKMNKLFLENDALALAELVKKKEAAPIELAEAAIENIEALNPGLNAVINKMYDQAKKAALSADLEGIFAGVPMLLKDITQEIAGERITSGSKALQNYRAKNDSEFVARLRRTGAIFIGQTNVPELALMGITEPEFYGPARNPWNPDYTPGGSSGGSAAAVASGMVPIAGANDGGGSIRIPAAYCGLFGLKPGRGRTPAGPGIGRHWQGASSDHVLTRSVRDSAAMLDELHGPEKGGAFYAIPPSESYLGCLEKPLPKTMKIAYTTASPLGTDVHPDCREAVLRTAAILEDLGYRTEEAEPDIDGKKLAQSYITMYFGEVAAALAGMEETLGRKVSRTDVEASTWLLGMLGKTISAGDFVLSMREWDKAAYVMDSFHETYDFYLTPATAFPPARIGELSLKNAEKTAVRLISMLKLGKLAQKAGLAGQLAENSLKRTPFTQLANLTGQPAMSVPLHSTAEGLPCGVQFMAAKGREDLLFRLAFELEQTPHWLRKY